MSKEVQPKPVKQTHFMRRVFIEAILLLGVFLLGFVPMWLKSHDSASRLARLQTAMTSAAMDAH